MSDINLNWHNIIVDVIIAVIAFGFAYYKTKKFGRSVLAAFIAIIIIEIIRSYSKIPR